MAMHSTKEPKCVFFFVLLLWTKKIYILFRKVSYFIWQTTVTLNEIWREQMKQGIIYYLNETSER